MKCAIYTRVCTDQNCEHQIHELQQYANRQGWAIVETFQDVMSGAQVNRPDLNRLMRDAFRQITDAYGLPDLFRSSAGQLTITSIFPDIDCRW